MKTHKLATLISIFAASASVSAFAATAEGLSYTNYISVGPTAADNSGTHTATAGMPGIGIKSAYGGKRVSFANLTNLAKAKRGGSIDKNSVVRIPASTANHRANLGSFNFQQAGGNEVYFGEWTAAGNTSGSTRTVYYSGSSRATNFPTSGAATYQVRGINRYNGANVMTGSLRADYGRRTLVGSMKNSALTVGVNATINPSQASFSGTATAGGQRGTASGHFYGSRATGIAGITRFSNRAYDTAFGGRR